MKKGLKLLFIIVMIGSLLLGCSDNPSKEHKINEVTNINYNDITKIVFYDGRGWNEPVTINDSKKVNDFIKIIDRFIIKKEKDHEDSKGWIHKADFYNGNTKLMSVIFTSPLKINGNYYDTVNGKLSTEEIDHYISSVNPSWKN